jgi:hypothetical protein
MFRMFIFLMLTLPSLAFAFETKPLPASRSKWWPANGLPAKDPVDTMRAQYEINSSGNLVVEIQVTNAQNFHKKCDAVVTVVSVAPNGLDVGTEKAFIQEKIIKAKGTDKLKVVFESAHLARSYVVRKESTRVHYSCIGFSNEQNLNEIPKASTLCNPDLSDSRGCENTCQAAKDSPQKCASPNQDWNNDATQFL